MDALMNWLKALALVYLLLVGVSLIGDGFNLVSGGSAGAERIFSFASNPITGVILGTLATALVQSSSTVTSVIVALVAGGMPVAMAVPMIMGANMGTTITNTFVSLGNLGDSKAFRRSFQAATVHDFFNFFSIVIFLPIEMLFHPLERSALYLSQWVSAAEAGGNLDLDFIGAATGPVADQILLFCETILGPWGGHTAIIVGITLVISAVIYLGQVLRSVMTGHAQELVNKAIGSGPARGVATGAAVTVLVQSSSTTTSLVVPLAGAGVLTTRQVFPFTMGANLGTCITALLAATAVEGDHVDAALQIALVHLLYNLAGVTMFLFIPWLHQLPIRSARWLGAKVEQHRAWALAYIVGVFFAFPGAVFLASDHLSEPEMRPTAESKVDFELE